jgi:LAO/AO transport system kinase
MQEHASDGDVFIRSIGTRGGQGGISRSTQEVVMLLDAAGFDLIILETAGVGQTELGVLEVAQSIIVVLVPESGDDIQMMKAGILEIADILVVNKCDRQGSDHVVKELRAMLELSSGTSSWTIPVVKTIAERGEGVREVHERADEHWKFLKKSGALKSRNRRFARTAVINIIRDLVASAASTSMNHPQGLALVDAVAERELDPFTAAQKFLSGKF